MTQRTGNEVQKETEKIRPEEDHHFTMEMGIFAQ